MRKHWTSVNAKDFAFAVSMDFIADLELAMQKKGIAQKELAKTLGISEGRVSQVVNNPGNLTLRSAVEWARAIGMKIALVAYDDGDESNQAGPMVPEVFRSCWEALGKPCTGQDLEDARQQACLVLPEAAALLPAANDNTFSKGGWKTVQGGLKYWSRESAKRWSVSCRSTKQGVGTGSQSPDDCQCIAGG